VPEASLNSLSVIIPTYNRKNLLAKAIEGYLRQRSPELIRELLIVDDGSTDGSESMVRDFGGRSAFPIRYLRQPNQGPAAARNLGIRETRSPLALFTDSDIVPESTLVEQHFEWHQKHPQMTAAVLGYVTWPPEINATPFMRWYGETEMFGFDRLRNNQEASFHFFYTCNISLKTEFLRTCGQFDEEFRSAAYEDTELGYRLSKQGLQLFYNSAAVAYHHQFFSFEDACRKKVGNAVAAQLFFRKEAGRQVLKESEAKHSRIGYALAKGFAPAVARVISPARRVLDSSLPMPRIVYRLFYWASTAQPRRQGSATDSRNEARPDSSATASGS
jgi:glycosyltransferase involved in cell wall biosynthesis